MMEGWLPGAHPPRQCTPLHTSTMSCRPWGVMFR